MHVLDQYYEYMIVVLYTDDFFCLYHDSSSFHRLLFHMCKCFPCASQQGPVITFINFLIVQSKHGISFDQTYHIKQTGGSVGNYLQVGELGHDTAHWDYFGDITPQGGP